MKFSSLLWIFKVEILSYGGMCYYFAGVRNILYRGLEVCEWDSFCSCSSVLTIFTAMIRSPDSRHAVASKSPTPGALLGPMQALGRSLSNIDARAAERAKSRAKPRNTAPRVTPVNHQQQSRTQYPTRTSVSQRKCFLMCTVVNVWGGGGGKKEKRLLRMFMLYLTVSGWFWS